MFLLFTFLFLVSDTYTWVIIHSDSMRCPLGTLSTTTSLQVKMYMPPRFVVSATVDTFKEFQKQWHKTY